MVSKPYLIHGLVGVSEKVMNVIDFIRLVAPSKLNVLIQGESGTGKEETVKAIYCNSGLSGKFVVVNCAALPRDLVESELFGHEKGSFTGATARKPGQFELAHNGILFLDEIGDIPLHVQPKLLRAIECRTIRRVGGVEDIPVFVRVIAATNKDLPEAVKRNEFREDLYYRLCMVTITLPSLRERREDIPILARHFVQSLSGVKAFGIQGKPTVTGISPDALAILCNHDWPGNVRELRNAIVCGITYASGDTIQADDLKIGPARAQNAAVDPPTPETLLEHVFRTKRQFVIDAYKEVNGNATELAKRIPTDRKSLPRLLDSLGLSHLKQHNRGCRPLSSRRPPEERPPAP